MTMLIAFTYFLSFLPLRCLILQYSKKYVNPQIPLDINSINCDKRSMMKRKTQWSDAMGYDMTKEQAVIIMRALAYAQEFGTEYANAEFQIEYYNIGAAFDLLDEEQIKEMDNIIGDCEQIIAEYDFENGYQRSNMR